MLVAMTTAARHAVIYCRISRDHTGAGLGVDRQREACEKLAAALGLIVLRVFVDNDLSAYSGMPRPQYLAMLELLRRREASYLITWHPDRLCRHPRELEDLIDVLEQTATTVKTCVAGDYDLGSPDGRTYARILGAMARGESEHKADRQKLKTQSIATAGGWPGGTRPFGYDPQSGAQVPAEADAVRSGARMIIEGQSVMAVMRAWNDLGLTTTFGNRWARSPVRTTLMRPDLCALRIYNGDEYPLTWITEPILDRDTWEKVRALLTNPQTSVPHARTRLLHGFLYCSGCGGVMSSTVANEKAAYGCKADDHGRQCPRRVSIQAPQCDDFVRDEVIAKIVRSPEVTAKTPDSETAEIKAQISAVKRDLEQLQNDRDSGHYETARYYKRYDLLQGQLAALGERLTASQAYPVLDDLPRDPIALRVLWDAATVDWQRAVIASSVARIVILPAVPGRRFDNGRISLTPR